MEPQQRVRGPVRRTRSANWSPDEVAKLLKMIQAADMGPARTLEGPGAKLRRGRVWSEITERFNEGGVVYRDTEALKKKLKNLRMTGRHYTTRVRRDIPTSMAYPQDVDYVNVYDDRKPWIGGNGGLDSMEVQEESMEVNSPSLHSMTSSPRVPSTLGARPLTLAPGYDPALTPVTSAPTGPTPTFPGATLGSTNPGSDGFTSPTRDSPSVEGNTDRETLEEEEEEGHVEEEENEEEDKDLSSFHQPPMSPECKATPLVIIPTEVGPPPPPPPPLSRTSLEQCKAYNKKARVKGLHEELLEIEIRNAKAEELKRQKDIELTVFKIAESKLHSDLLQLQLKAAQEDSKLRQELSEIRIKESKQNIEESKIRIELMKLKRDLLLKQQ